MTKEEMRDVFGYEGLYKITNNGKVFSLEKTWVGGKGGTFIRNHPIIELKQSTCKGYKVVGLRRNGKQRMFKVHRLVAIAFIPNPLNKAQINHKNGIKHDNRVENLEWVTQSENQQHCNDIGLRIPVRGEKNGRAKLTDLQIFEILNSNEQTKIISEKYGISISYANSIRARTKRNNFTNNI